MNTGVSPRNTALGVVKAIGAVIGFFFLWSVAGSFMTAKSDVSVFIGVILYLALFGMVVYCGVRLWNRFSPQFKKYLVVALVIGEMGIIGGCTKVEPGYVGIKVNQYGTQRGVEDFPIVTGRVTYNPFTEDVYKFPTFLQSIVWTKDSNEGSPNDDSITFNSVEGAVINADIALSYGFDGDRVPALFVEFRKPAEHITDVYMRSQVRDSFNRFASKMRVVNIYGEEKQKLLDDVKNDLIERLGPKGFRFDMVSFVGALRVDDKVANSINATIEATQRAIEAENKVRQSKAEAQQKVAEAEGQAQSILLRANAQAEANRTVAESLTPELIQWQSVEKWNGEMPQVIGGGAVPFVQLPAVGSK